MLLPGYTATPGAYALVGMGTLFAGIVRAPMTSVLMIFEMTRDYAVIVPLMIANLTSLFIASRFQKEPIYEALADQDGIHLPTARGHEESSERNVAGVMEEGPRTLPAEMSVAEAMERSRSGSGRGWPVVDGEHFLGLLTSVALACAVAEGKQDQPIGSLVETLHLPHLHRDHALHVALERFSKYDLDLLPVLHRADIHKLEGVVTLRAVLAAYGVKAGIREQD
jgi:CIC family chloride channel protein